MKKFKRKFIPDPVDPKIEELDRALEVELEDEDDEEWDEDEDEDDDLEIEDWELDEDEDEDEEEEEEEYPWDDDDIEYDEYGDETLNEKMATSIRAGLYVPKREDPWSAHLLYNALKDTGKL
jgi:hypothetical protein